MREIEVITIEDPIGYAEMLERQRARRAEVENGDAPNTLFLLEHTPTITRGRNASKEHVLAPVERLAEMGVEVHDVDRGGGVTYHGPGQLVAYPVLNLHEWDRSIGWYLRTLEQVLIDLLAGYRIESQRVEGFTGVWTAQGKIAAIGIGIHHWITYHGVALNVFTNMEHFRLIVPCGIADRPVASLQQLMLLPPHMPKAREDFTRVFMRHFA